MTGARTIVLAALVLGLAISGLGGGGARGEVRTVCTGDRKGQVCMPMDCHGASCRPAPPPAKPMQWADLLSRPRPKPDRRFTYGPSPSQVIDLWRPAGKGPFRVVAMIHGGCWDAAIAKLDIMDWAAADLRRRGIAVWNIEYRRLGEKGGGYPGTYQDVSAALDRLRAEAPGLGLTLRPLVVVGHSAGGHLALWAAMRPKLPRSSPLRTEGALKLDGVVDVAGLADLEKDSDTACGAERVAQMAGASSPARPNPYADTSPAHLVPSGVRTIVVHGTEDETVPLAVGEAYAAKARAAGDRVEVRSPPGGHVEEISPGAPAWNTVVAAILELMK